MGLTKSKFEKACDKHIPRILNSSYTTYISNELRKVKIKLKEDYLDFLNCLIYVSAVPLNKRTSRDHDYNHGDFNSFHLGISIMSGEETMEKLKIFEPPSRPEYLTDLLNLILGEFDNESITKLFVTSFYIKECEPVLRTILNKTSIILDVKAITVVLDEVVSSRRLHLLQWLGGASYPSDENNVLLTLTQPALTENIHRGHLIAKYKSYLLYLAVYWRNVDIFDFILNGFWNNQSSQYYVSYYKKSFVFMDSDLTIGSLSRKEFEELVVCRCFTNPVRDIEFNFIIDLCYKGSRDNIPKFPFVLDAKMKREWTDVVKGDKEIKERVEHILTSLLVNNFPCSPIPFAVEVFASMTLKSAMKIYIHRPDLRNLFSRKRKVIGERVLDTRRTEIGNRMMESNTGREDIMQNVMTGYI